MDLNFRRIREKKKKDNAETLRTQRKRREGTGEANGSVVVVNEVGGVRGCDITCDRYAGSVLARVFELAREISARIAGGAAAGAAADRARILRIGSDGPARAAGKTVDRTLRTRTGVHIRRTDSGVSAVQLSICGAAADRFV